MVLALGLARVAGELAGFGEFGDQRLFARRVDPRFDRGRRGGCERPIHLLPGRQRYSLELGGIRHHQATLGTREVDLGDDRAFLRLPRLEELGHPGQTAGDVLRLRRLARDLRDDLTGRDLLAFVAR